MIIGRYTTFKYVTTILRNEAHYLHIYLYTRVHTFIIQVYELKLTAHKAIVN